MNAGARRYTQDLPRYNTALGMTETLAATPPFTFQGVTARVFPLLARMNSLRDFCRQYLNVAPEVCEFRPYLPYVFLMVLDYGRMAIEELNTGWVSQNEVFFAVPLTMWRRSPRGLVFDRWILSTPFIFVDDARSLSGGRESYGWPKVLGELQTSPERWLIDPRNPTRFLSLDIRNTDSENPGVRLLDIEQRTGQNASLVPPDLGLLDPLTHLSRLTRTSLMFGNNLAQLLLAAPLLGFDSGHSGSRRTVLFESLSRLRRFLVRPGLEAVTLKQFRDAECPTQCCYQALVGSRLGVTRYNRGGFLGAYNILLGDVTGGFRIRLHDNPAFPILESLGLEVAEERTFRMPAARRQTVSLLEPILPFWLSVDLNYGKGHTICWRTRKETRWHIGDVPVGRPRPNTHYNTIAGGAEQVWYGPFQIPEGSFDVYPLKTKPGRMDEFLKDCLKTGDKISFKATGDHVFMVASSIRIFSRSRSASWLESRQFVFYVPLRWKRSNEQRWERALAVPFAFVDNPIVATTLREVQGAPAMNARIESLSRFLRRQGPLLRVFVDVFAAVGAGLPSEQRPFIEIQPGEKKEGQIPNPQESIVDAVFPAGDLDRLTLKQLRDSEEPDRACYQSLVREPWSVTHKGKAKGLDYQMKIRIYRYPSLPLVDILGLETKAEQLHLPDRPGGAVADVLEPDQPFRIELSAEIGLGKELAYTAESLPWL